MWAIPIGISSALKKKSGKESQYMFSHPETGADPLIGSDWESRCDSCSINEWLRCNVWFLLACFAFDN